MTHRTAFVALCLVLLPAAANAKLKLAVLPTQFDESSAGKVPKLFDDYLLAAVQNAGDYEVIGQDDITALLGFEKQKDLVGCDDMSCIADIGGALGVDRLVVVKIAHLQNEWVSTAKLINIRDARVESRSSDFVSGDVRELLRAVPDIVRKLFAGGGNISAQTTPPTPAAPVATAHTPQLNMVVQPDPNLGRGARVAGGIIAGAGLAVAGLGALFAMSMATTSDCTYDYYSSTETCDEVTNYAGLVGGSMVYTSGLVMAGIGSGIYMNGKARAATGDGNATGHHVLSWIAWTLVPIAAIGPLAFADSNTGLAWGSGLGGAVGAAWIFAMRMWSSSTYARTSQGAAVPIAHVLHLHDSTGRHTPAVALAYSF